VAHYDWLQDSQYCNEPLLDFVAISWLEVGRLTSMGWIESSAKKILSSYVLRNKVWKTMDSSEKWWTVWTPPKLYCRTWENFPGEENRPANTCICLSGQKWVALWGRDSLPNRPWFKECHECPCKCPQVAERIARPPPNSCQESVSVSESFTRSFRIQMVLGCRSLIQSVLNYRNDAKLTRRSVPVLLS